MSAADAIIYRDLAAAAPVDYVVPAAAEIVPRVVTASYDGSAAGSTFLPCLKIKTADGRVVARLPINSGDVVAAGGSADVTWGPFLRKCPPGSAFFPSPQYNNAVLAFNPWAYWKLNEASGSSTCADSSGHGRTLNVTAALVNLGAHGLIPVSADTCAFCKFTSVASNLYLQTAAGQAWTDANHLSIEAWLSPSSQGGADKTIAVHGSISAPANFTWWLRLTNGIPIIATVNAGVQTTYTLGTTGILDNGSHQLVVVLDGTNVTAYVDQVQVGQVAQTATIGVPFTRIVYLNQGIGGAGARAWTGQLGPVAVYDRGLSAADVATLYNAATVLP